MFRGEGGKSFFQEAAIEIRIVGDEEHYPAKQIADSGIINPATSDHLIGDAGNSRDLGRDRETGIFEPLPGAENFVDSPGLTVVFEEADPEFDDLVAIGIGAGGFYIHDGGDELWAAIGWVVFRPRLQPTADAILAALDERPSHLFQRVPHRADVPNRLLSQRSTRQGAELR